MTRIRGGFLSAHPGWSEPSRTAIPIVEATIWLPSVAPPSPVRLLVDTGADITVLNPRDTSPILSPSDWEVVKTAPRRQVGGAGHDLDHYLLEAFIFFTDIEGGLEMEPFQAWIAEPNPLNADHESLLGRDVLQYFVLTMDRLASLTLDRARA